MTKVLARLLSDLFSPRSLQDLDAGELLHALNDPSVRKHWLWEVYDALKRMNLDVDRKLHDTDFHNFELLCARRRAYQDILSAILAAHRQVTNNNLADSSNLGLDVMTE